MMSSQFLNTSVIRSKTAMIYGIFERNPTILNKRPRRLCEDLRYIQFISSQPVLQFVFVSA